MSNATLVRDYFSLGGKSVTMQELKALSDLERQELAALIRATVPEALDMGVALGVPPAT